MKILRCFNHNIILLQNNLKLRFRVNFLDKYVNLTLKYYRLDNKNY